MLRVELPWPDKRLSPNSRTHWRPKAEATAAARKEAFVLTRNQQGAYVHLEDGQLAVSFTFRPPTKARRDLDNLISATKAHRDGIADALSVDDSKFRLTAQMGPVVKGGKVIVEIA